MIKIKQKIFIFASLIIASVLVLIIFAILPFFGQVRAISKEIKNQEESAKLVSLEQKIQKLEQNLALLKQKLFNQDQAIELIRALEQMAIKTNNELSLNILTSDSLVLQISLKGDLIALISFLEYLESTSYLISAESLNMNFNPDEQIWQSNLKIRVYSENDIERTIKAQEAEKKKKGDK